MRKTVLLSAFAWGVGCGSDGDWLDMQVGVEDAGTDGGEDAASGHTTANGPTLAPAGRVSISPLRERGDFATPAVTTPKVAMQSSAPMIEVPAAVAVRASPSRRAFALAHETARAAYEVTPVWTRTDAAWRKAEAIPAVSRS